MAAKKTEKGPNKPGYDFIIAQLQRDPGIEYATVRERAEKKGLKLFPIMYGRAKLDLGLVKPNRKSTKKKVTSSATKGKKTNARRGRPAGSRSGSSKSDQIRDLLQTGLSNADIAKKVGCSPNLVYAVKSKAGGVRRGAGRPRKVGASDGALSDVVAHIRESDRQLEAMREVLKQISDLAGSVT